MFEQIYAVMLFGFVCAMVCVYTYLMEKHRKDYAQNLKGLVQGLATEKDKIIERLHLMLLAKNAYEYAQATSMVEEGPADKAETLEELYEKLKGDVEEETSQYLDGINSFVVDRVNKGKAGAHK